VSAAHVVHILLQEKPQHVCQIAAPNAWTRHLRWSIFAWSWKWTP